ncbi:MAG: hypothetical protein Q4P15_07230 [Propionibacteriaceae bacterium]|nr:hypothetical protein [Propionibacteriaceae bacterium]
MRNVGNIANLSTPLGIIVALAGGARLRMVNGLVVAECAVLPGISASAMTIGSVVLIRGRTLEEATRRIPGLLEHEGHHAHQWAYCFGLPFIPLYMAATGWSWLRSADRAAANLFEVQAGLALGGYTARDKRPLRAGGRALRSLVSAAVARRSGPPGAACGADADA